MSKIEQSLDELTQCKSKTSTIICRSAARSGKTVLHLDQADSYGSAWSSLNMDQFLVWANQTSSFTAMSPVRQQTGLQESATTIAADAAGADLLQVPMTHEQAQTYSNTQLHQQPVGLGSSREFSLDLAGKAGTCCLHSCFLSLICQMTSSLATTGSVLRIRHHRHYAFIWRPQLFRVQAASGQVSLFCVHLALPRY